MFLKHEIMICYILLFGLKLFAMEENNPVPVDVINQYFCQKNNNLNQASWDLSGTNIYSKKFIIIWVPNSSEYFGFYEKLKINLQDKQSKNKAWIRARLPAEWWVETKKVENGTYRIIKNSKGRKKFGIKHHIVADSEGELFANIQIVTFEKNK